MNVGKNNLAAKLNSDRLFGQLIVGGTLQLRNGGTMEMRRVYLFCIRLMEGSNRMGPQRL